MERYLDGEELGAEEVAHALKDAVTRGELFPVACGVATKNLGTTALLDLLVEGVPSPAKKGAPIEVDGRDRRVRLQDDRRPVRRPDQRLPRAQGHGQGRLDARERARRTAKERIGTLLALQGKDHAHADEFGPGDIGAVAKLKDVQTGDLLLDAELDVELPKLDFPEPVMSFAVTPKAKGDEEKVAHVAAPPLRGGSDARPPPRPADGRAAALGPEPDARRGRGRPAASAASASTSSCTSRACRTSRRSAASRGRRAATRSRPAAAASSATATSCSSRSRATTGYEFVDKIVGGVIPQGFRPAVDKGIQEAMLHGELAGAPGPGRPRAARRRLVPHGRLVGDGVQDRRLDGVQGRVREGRARCCSSRSWSSR